VLVGVDELGDASGLRVSQRLNDETLQDASTDDFLFDVPTVIAHASAAFTLEPGDVILTGTPWGCGEFMEPRRSLAPGDVVECEIEGIGLLRNPVVAE
jgi:2-keto-4-pentenoate hydratase/2-oxohepta-3-ene-1,7-dioic acid hydratase in catechol pathway